MIIDVNPLIAQLGPFSLTWEGLFDGTGALVGFVVASRNLRSVGIDPEPLYGILPWVVLAAIVGARVLHVADSWDYYAVHPLDIVAVTRGGASLYGALLVGTAAAFVLARRRHWPLGVFFDATAPAQALGLALGYVGSLLTGSYLGRPTPSALAVEYVNPHSFDHRHLPVEPAAAYAIVWCLAILALLILLHRRGLPDGFSFWIFTALFALGQVWIGSLRDLPPDAFSLGQPQIIGLIVGSVSVVVLAVEAVRYVLDRRARGLIRE